MKGVSKNFRAKENTLELRYEAFILLKIETSYTTSFPQQNRHEQKGHSVVVPAVPAASGHASRVTPSQGKTSTGKDKNQPN